MIGNEQIRLHPERDLFCHWRTDRFTHARACECDGESIMVAPLVVVGAGVLGSIALGYLYETKFGDGHYSQRDLAIDATLGLIPGVGYAKPVVSIARKGNILRRMGYSKGMYSTRELYMYPFIDDALQIFYRTPVVGAGVSGLYGYVAKLGDNRAKSNPDRTDLSRKPKIRGATQVKPKKGKCPPGYYYNKKKKMCIKRSTKSRSHSYNKKRI